MKFGCVVQRGWESLAEDEIKCFGNVEIQDGIVICDMDSWSKVSKALMLIQIPFRCGILLDKAKGDLRVMDKLTFEYLDDEVYRLDCVRVGKHNFSSEDIKRNLASKINKKIVYSGRHKQILVVVIGEEWYILLDLWGIDSRKRYYKVFQHPASLQGTMASALLQFAGYSKEKIMLDPCMGCGVIPIEAALKGLSQSQWTYFNEGLWTLEKEWKEMDKIVVKPLPIYGYDMQLRWLKAAQKNAKLAGVDKAITFSKVDLEWLDTKHIEKSVDLIVTQPMEDSLRRNGKKIEEFYRELFHQASFILKKHGFLVVVLNHEQKFLDMSKDEFILEKRLDFNYGDANMCFLKLKKK